jgi:hypothetical protein
MPVKAIQGAFAPPPDSGDSRKIGSEGGANRRWLALRAMYVFFDDAYALLDYRRVA